MELEVQMEHAIRHMITSLRRNELRLGTEWDDQLSYMLGPALCQYLIFYYSFYFTIIYLTSLKYFGTDFDEELY